MQYEFLMSFVIFQIALFKIYFGWYSNKAMKSKYLKEETNK